MNRGITLYIIALGCFFTSCKKLVEIGSPANELPSEKVFTSDETALAVVRGLYIQMTNFTSGISGGIGSVSYLCGLSSDELENFQSNQSYTDFYQNTLLPDNSLIKTNMWQNPYNYIFHANSIIEGLQSATGVSAEVKNQLEGEAKFIRAFCYFYLINLFGDVPLITSTDYRVNRIMSRTATQEIYSAISSDLEDAKKLMVSDYSIEGGQRIRPNKWAAAALLSRIYLYVGEWEKAEAEASLLIDNNPLFSLKANLDDVFIKNSSEAIWQLMPTNTANNTPDANLFIVTAANPSVALSQYQIGAFESGDLRKIKWTSSFSDGTTIWPYVNKYKIKTGGTPLNEYIMVLRLAEQYLIRGEARIHLNNVSLGIDDINSVRDRAIDKTLPVGDPMRLAPISTNLTKEEALEQLMKEKRVELFTEWGHRWLDLKRIGKADAELSTIKGSSWQSTDIFYPIPASEIANNPNLTQNSGYE